MSRACCTRSGGPATSSAPRAAAPARALARASEAFDRLPIRTRLAGVSALLTFVILCAFAVVIGSLTVHRVRSDFNREVSETAESAARRDAGDAGAVPDQPPNCACSPTPATTPSIRILGIAGDVLAPVPPRGPVARSARAGTEARGSEVATVDGYRVVTALLSVVTERDGVIVSERARDHPVRRPVGPTEATVAPGRAAAAARRARRDRARAARGDADRAAGDEADRRAHLERRGDRAHTRPLRHDPPAAGRRRGGRARAHARRHAPRARRRPQRDGVHARPPAPVRRRRLARAAHAADERAREPRAARGIAATATRARRRARRFAPRSGCAGWWPTCCCWRAATPPA